MGKKKPVFQNQLKTLEDLKVKVAQLISQHSNLPGSTLGIAFRTVIEPNSSTLYKEGHHGKGAIYSGVRECDYKISESDPNWVIASSEHGLSFSSTITHAVNTIQFLGKFQKKGTKVSCAYWILEDADSIPDKMAFVQDPDNTEHFLLTITEDMKITDLVFKLNWIADRVTTMNDLALEAYKDA